MANMYIDLSPSQRQEVHFKEFLFQRQVTQVCGIALVMVIEDATESSLEVMIKNIQQDFIRQVILVDNGNTQSIQQWLQRFVAQAPHLSLIRTQRLPQGQVLGKALSRVIQPLVMILDQNHQMMNHATWHLLVAAQMMSGSWMMGVRRRGRANQDLPSCLYLPTPLEALKQLFKIQRSPALKVARTNGLKPYYVPAANAACLFMPTDVWNQSQGWDTLTTVVGGYSDFCLRLHEQAGSVYYLPEVTITEMLPRVHRWRHQVQSAWGLVGYFNRHYAKTSRILRWPLGAFLGAVCILAPWVNLLKVRIKTLCIMGGSV